MVRGALALRTSWLRHGFLSPASRRTEASGLRTAAYMGHTDVVKYLINKGADVHATCRRFDDRAFTPLHLAAWSGRADVVRTLLTEGADANLKTKKGRTALYFAQERDHTDVVNLLRTHAATKAQD